MARKSIFRRNQLHDLVLILAIIGASYASPTSLIVGGAVFALGLFVTAWSKLVLQRNYELATNGPYAICRHPFYLGNAIMDLGLCVMSGYLWLVLLFPLIFHVCYRRTFAYEEAHLKELHPESHARFSETTPLVLPLGKRIFRDWRATLDWGNLFDESIVSRSMRHLAYPPLVILAYRLWNAPFDAFNTTNLFLMATVISARIVSGAFFAAFEHGDRNKSTVLVARLFTGYPMMVWGLLIIAASLIWERNAYGVLEVIPWGLAMLSIETGIRGIFSRSDKLRAGIIAPLASGFIGITMFVLLNTAYLAPVALAVIISRIILPRTSSRRLGYSRSFIPALAAAGLVLSISGIAAEIYFDGHVIKRLVEQVESISRDDDMVVVVKDNDLNPLNRLIRVDFEVTIDELESLLAQRSNDSARLIVIGDEYDLKRTDLNIPLSMVTNSIIGSGIDKFRVLVF